MAGPVSGSTARTGPRRSVLTYIAIGFLALIVLVGIVVLITWLAIRPRKLVYTVETGRVNGFNLHYNHLNSSYGFVIRAYNPNKKVAVYYDSIDVAVLYDDEAIAFQTLSPFFQPRRNVTRLNVKPTGNNVALEGSVPKDLRLEKSSGVIELDVRMKARIRFKVGRWKSSHYKLKVKCSRVVVHLSAPKRFGTTECDVDI